MAFKLWFGCPHPWLIDEAGEWHRSGCRKLAGINPNDLLELAANERVAVERAPGRCHTCWPETRIVGGPVQQ